MVKLSINPTTGRLRLTTSGKVANCPPGPPKECPCAGSDPNGIIVDVSGSGPPNPAYLCPADACDTMLNGSWVLPRPLSIGPTGCNSSIETPNVNCFSVFSVIIVAGISDLGGGLYRVSVSFTQGGGYVADYWADLPAADCSTFVNVPLTLQNITGDGPCDMSALTVFFTFT